MRLLIAHTGIVGKILLSGALVLIISGCAPSVEKCEPGVGDISRMETVVPPCS